MSHSLGNDKIYEELRGYFPPEYDLTPDELEKEIELENKKRELALAMMRVQHVDDVQLKSKGAFSRSSVSMMHTDHDIPVIKRDSAVKAAPAPTPAPVKAEAEPARISKPAEEQIAKSEPDTAFFETAVLPVINIKEDPDSVEARAPIAPEASAVEEVPDEALDTAADEVIDIPKAEEVTGNLFFEGFDPLNDLFDEMEDTATDRQSEDEEPYVDTEALENARKPVNFFFDFLEIFAICITCIIVVFGLFFRLTKVSGESMEDTLYEDEYLVVSDFFYEPKCGDIVVLQNTSLELSILKEPLVKRVIAVGGESVYISKTGMVTVTRADGTEEVLDQPYIKKEPYSGYFGRRYDVPEGCVFVMGDNRNHSTDSRSDLVGVVDERCIFGKALVRVLPFNVFTVFENPYND